MVVSGLTSHSVSAKRNGYRANPSGEKVSRSAETCMENQVEQIVNKIEYRYLRVLSSASSLDAAIT